MKWFTVLLCVVSVAILAGCATMTCRDCRVKCEKKPGMFLSEGSQHPGWQCPKCGLVYDRADIDKE